MITPRFTPCAGLEVELAAAVEPELFAELVPPPELVLPLEGAELFDVLPPLVDGATLLVAFLPEPAVVPVVV
ncbi:MAG: hypothetical protein ACRDLM_06270 [Gaiellaceae bacterium]